MGNNIKIEIITALKNGDHKAFEFIFLTYYDKIRIFIFGYLKSEPDAEELTEDLFVELWVKRDLIDTSMSFNSYLHTIARNSAFNFLKRKHLYSTYIAEVSNSEYSSTTEEDMIAKELYLMVDDVVDKMPEQRKQIYRLSKNKGFSNSEIADQLNTTKRNVESQLSLALKELRKVISAIFSILL